MPVIQTERLQLMALSMEQLRRLLERPEVLELDLGLLVSRSMLTVQTCGAIRKKLAKMEPVDPVRHPWFTYWLIVESAGGGIGLVGFKGDPQVDGEVEIGYVMALEARGRGYMTEAARALIEWAFQSVACRAVIAPNTLRTNPASNRVLQKLGMRVYHQTAEALFWRIRAGDSRQAVLGGQDV